MHNCAKGDLRAQVLSATPGAKASPDQMVPRPHPGSSWTVLRRERRPGGSPRIDSCEKTISSHYLFISIFICHQTAFQIKINMTDSYSECGFEENCLFNMLKIDKIVNSLFYSDMGCRWETAQHRVHYMSTLLSQSSS